MVSIPFQRHSYGSHHNYDGVPFYVFYGFNVSFILMFEIVPSTVMYWCLHSFTFQTPCGWHICFETRSSFFLNL